MRKFKNWEPQYTVVPTAYLQQIVQDVVNATLSGYQGGGTANVIGSDIAAVNLLNLIKDTIMSVDANVQALVDQVTASKSVEAASAAALAQLVTQSKDLSDKVAALTAAGTGMSAADAALLASATKDLHDSATALAAAVPTNTAPPAPADVIPPVAPVAAPAAVDPAVPAA